MAIVSENQHQISQFNELMKRLKEFANIEYGDRNLSYCRKFSIGDIEYSLIMKNGLLTIFTESVGVIIEPILTVTYGSKLVLNMPIIIASGGVLHTHKFNYTQQSYSFGLKMPITNTDYFAWMIAGEYNMGSITLEHLSMLDTILMTLEHTSLQNVTISTKLYEDIKLLDNIVHEVSHFLDYELTNYNNYVK